MSLSLSGKARMNALFLVKASKCISLILANHAIAAVRHDAVRALVQRRGDGTSHQSNDAWSRSPPASNPCLHKSNDTAEEEEAARLTAAETDGVDTVLAKRLLRTLVAGFLDWFQASMPADADAYRPRERRPGAAV